MNKKTTINTRIIMFRDVAEAIIKSPKWKYALRNHTVEQNGKETTPFRKLIQRMPGTGINYKFI